MPDDSTPLLPGDRVKLTADGEKRYPHRKGQSGTVVRLSDAAPGLVAVRWQDVTTTDYYGAKWLEIDTE
jgi:hypothetical protein